MATFKAIVIDKADAGQTVRLADFDEKDLMDGDVTVRVEWSTVNYKDGLARHRQGAGGAPLPDDRRRRFRRHGGILLASGLEAGRQGHPQRLGPGRDPSRRLCAKRRASRATGWCGCRPSMSARDAMAIGTAGYTAMLAVMALERAGLDAGARPDGRDRRRRRRRLGRRRAPRQARLRGRSPRPAGRRRPTTSRASAPPKLSSARN